MEGIDVLEKKLYIQDSKESRRKTSCYWKICWAHPVNVRPRFYFAVIFVVQTEHIWWNWTRESGQKKSIRNTWHNLKPLMSFWNSSSIPFFPPHVTIFAKKSENPTVEKEQRPTCWWKNSKWCEQHQHIPEWKNYINLNCYEKTKLPYLVAFSEAHVSIENSHDSSR